MSLLAKQAVCSGSPDLAGPDTVTRDVGSMGLLRPRRHSTQDLGHGGGRRSGVLRAESHLRTSSHARLLHPTALCFSGSCRGKSSLPWTGKGAQHGPVAALTSAAGSLPPGEGESAPSEGLSAARVWQWMRLSAPRMDSLDTRIFKLFIPAMVNMLLGPMVGAVDVYWVGHMNQTSTLAAMGAANQVFDAVYVLISFLPIVVTPIIAKASARGDQEQLREKVGEAMLLTLAIGALGTALISTFPQHLLSMVGMAPGSEMSEHAVSYMVSRSISLIPGLASTVAFATYRGMMDNVTPMKISAVAQLTNALLDPVLIFGLPALGFAPMGVAGAAAATAFSEFLSFFLYAWLLFKSKILSLQAVFRVPQWAAIVPLLVGGVAVQLRALAMQGSFVMVAKTAIALDATGTAAAAHTIAQQMFRIGLYMMLALSGLANAMVPQALNRRPDGGIEAGRQVANRLLMWGLIGGLVLGTFQLCSLPLLKVFSTIPAVQAAAVVPCMVGALVQFTTGMVFVAEGIMGGHQAFRQLAFNTLVAALAFAVYVQTFGTTLGRVWLGFWVFTNIRLVAAMYHHFIAGPLSGRHSKAGPSGSKEPGAAAAS